MRALDFFFAARPMLQLPIWTVYLISLHFHHERSGGLFAWMDIGVMCGISLLFAAAAYLNQVADCESDRINRKVGFLQKGILNQSQLLVGFVVSGIIALAASALVGIFLLFLFAQFFLLTYAYSAPPFRLKDRPTLGLLANAYGHGTLVAVSVIPRMTGHNAGLLDWSIPLYFFFCVGGTYVATTIPDRLGDKATGKHTLAVVLGRSWALLISLLMMLISGVIAYLSGHSILLSLSLLASALALAAILTHSDNILLLSAKLPLLLLTILSGYYYPWYLLFVVALIAGCRIYYKQRFNVVYPRLS